MAATTNISSTSSSSPSKQQWWFKPPPFTREPTTTHQAGTPSWIGRHGRHHSHHHHPTTALSPPSSSATRCSSRAAYIRGNRIELRPSSCDHSSSPGPGQSPLPRRQPLHVHYDNRGQPVVTSRPTIEAPSASTPSSGPSTT